VASLQPISLDRREDLIFSARNLQLRWYAAYTSANHEKRVTEHLMLRSVEHFLPTYTSVRKWKDRRVRLDLPLFPGYVFVRLVTQDRLRVLQIPGVAKLVGFGGIPAALPDEDIEALKRVMVCGTRAEPHPFLSVGRRVRVKAGPLEGIEGVVVRKKNRLRLIILLDLIHRAAALEVDAADLELIGRTAAASS